MAEGALDENQQWKQGYLEMVAQSQTIKQRNLLLEQRNTDQTTKIRDLTQKQNEISENFNGYQKQTKQEKEDADKKAIKLEQRIRELETQLEETETSYEQQITKINEDNKVTTKQWEQKELNDLEKRTEADNYLQEKDRMLQDMKDLQEKLDNEKALRLEQVNQKELDRIKETEQLRKEMLFNIKKTKANLLAMNDKQLQTTTHLTILQNHQLTTELEHQSKQTEILIFKNNKMKQQIETYQREIEIHKEVEKELAKRSHFCQKVIKRLKQELSDATNSNQSKNNPAGSSLIGGLHSAGVTPRNAMNNMQRSANDYAAVRGGMANSSGPFAEELNKGNEDLINFLEQKLEQQERNMVVKGQEYEALLSEHQSLQNQFNQSKQKYKRAALLLTEFLDDILNSTPNILQPERDLHLNVEKIKETPLEELPKEDKVTLVLVLLKQLQPYLSTHNMNVAPPQIAQTPIMGKKPGQLGGSQPPVSGGRNHRASKTMTGGNNAAAGGVSASQDDEGINRILNNINVQTRKAGEQSGTNLPPIQHR